MLAITMILAGLSATLSAPAEVVSYTLPDPLVTLSGDAVTTPEAWTQTRRTEILNLFREHVYGHRSVERPADLRFELVDVVEDALDGAATRKQVDLHFSGPGGKGKIRLIMFIPNDAPKPVPAFLLICHRDSENIDPTRAIKKPFWPAEFIVSRGYVALTFQAADVDPDNYDEFQNGVHGIFREPGTKHAPNAWGTMSAWGWGASRCMDYLETDDAVNEKQVAVLGHSRGGKTALWCGAEDERFALVISNNSGCTGAALARRLSGERVARINRVFPHWFCENYSAFDDKEDEMPVDQHMLISLIAPRLVYVASASKDAWADPEGEFLSCVHAAPVYQLFGLDGLGVTSLPAPDVALQEGYIAYHMRAGKHDLNHFDWNKYMHFADRHFRR